MNSKVSDALTFDHLAAVPLLILIVIIITRGLHDPRANPPPHPKVYSYTFRVQSNLNSACGQKW